tara:strand:- start:260 stop:877 length:618 start_codon:yes stop_codon:yes gene_type:complete
MIKGIKICGVSDMETLKFIINHPKHPQFVGFITNYKKSKRFVEYKTLRKLTSIKSKKVEFVSVLVKPTDYILEKIKNLNFNYYQLYNVDPKRTKFIKNKYKKKIISSLTVENKNHFDKYKLYEKISDIILFDGKGYEKSVGFDHKLLKNLPKSIKFMVAGNISINNIPMIKNKDYIIDLSGSLENKKGEKDINKIDKFLRKVNFL